jgi:hypothetical protein
MVRRARRVPTAACSPGDGQGALFTTTSEPSAPTTSSPSTASPAASPAREPRRRGSGLASLILRLRCGPSSLESLASFDPATSSSRTWRTSSLSMTEPSGEPFSGTWPRSGMTWRGTAFPLPPSAPRTAVTGSSPLLPTPTAWRRRGRRAAGADNGNELGRALTLLPTPRSSDMNGAGSRPRWAGDRTAVKLLPTPNDRRLEERDNEAAADAEATDRVASRGRRSRAGQVLDDAPRALLSSGASTSPPSADGKPSTGLRLNPSFVGWMMGTPSCGECGREWTDPDCPHSATAFTSTSAGSSA